MDLSPLLEASLPIRVHVATILPAFLIGSWLIFVSRKGSPLHRAGGVVFVALMTVTALSALSIASQVWPLLRVGELVLGPIHLLVPYTLFGVWQSVRALRRGDHAAHGSAMRRLYFLAIFLAGAFTFAPGRVMYRMFIEQALIGG